MAYEALYTRGRPKTLSHLVGQEHISSALTRAVLSGRLSHAYLLVGTRGTGKTSTARLLAKAMNCDKIHDAVQNHEEITAKDIPCNECNSCRSIDSSPDNVEFDAASNRSVEDVTRLLSTAHLAPLQSRVKTFIIDEVHMLSFEAVNSILKLIEEPPPNVAFFLATTELQKVPMTIRSRCQVLNFRLIPQEIISKHLKKFAEKLNVDLEEDAAKKIARLAEGSMRDALTYLDQCYSMADEKISLDDVNKTLGLISDADLDEIIFAVKNQNRAEVGQAITHAFQSGLTSISIAESLITRLRDFEFKNLDGGKNSELQEIENFVGEIRRAVLEMQGSGVPDIILEMTLMNLAAPKIISVQPVQAVQPVQSVQSVQTTQQKISKPQENFTAEKNNTPSQEKLAEKISVPQTFTGSLDEGKKIFYDIFKSSSKDAFFVACLRQAEVAEFDGKILTLAFNGEPLAEVYHRDYKTRFENAAEKLFGIQIKTATIIKKNSYHKIRDNSRIPDENDAENKFLQNAVKVFQAEGYTQI
ncbi:MAG: DNA polymerase III subunit gamma/tau [Selenomonadaceae bacterium]|nr:DNA polymerase III subunit gamma/tau [Selenomonadaceae bacterium]